MVEKIKEAVDKLEAVLRLYNGNYLALLPKWVGGML